MIIEARGVHKTSRSGRLEVHALRGVDFGVEPGDEAAILVERNNHGHAVILALRQLGAALLPGLDGEIDWATTGASKHILFDRAAKDIRDGGLRLHGETTHWQLAAINGATLAAPPGQHDVRALACVLALAALHMAGAGRSLSVMIPPVGLMEGIDGPW